MSVFQERRSPRAFQSVDVPRALLEAIFEDVRWSPSCFNDQPWRFVVADGGQEREAFRGLLNEWNSKWAHQAPVVAFLLARKHFTHNDKPNRWAQFDAGAAWMALSLSAWGRGVACHAMGGVLFDEAPAVLGYDPDKYELCCGIVMGYAGDPSTLPAEFEAKERAPRERKELERVRTYGPLR